MALTRTTIERLAAPAVAALFALLALVAGHAAAAEESLRAATFRVDATPPLGAPLCYAQVAPAAAIDDPLFARGLVLLPPDQKPIILVAVDWVGICNDGNIEWRRQIAEAVGTTVERVAVHTLHQHDAPACDFDTERICAEHGLAGRAFDAAFGNAVIQRTAAAARKALGSLQDVTAIGVGQAKVEKVASTRRCLGEDGKVAYVRNSSCRDPKWQAYPEGTIDPTLKAVTLLSGDKPVVILTYYATHPQSHYGKGRVSADFPGLARSLFEAAVPGPEHIHFNGAAGDVTAGKYNDGSTPMRRILAERLAKGMVDAWNVSQKMPIDAGTINWKTREVALPPADFLDETTQLSVLDDATEDLRSRVQAARGIAWLRRCKAGRTITISRLRLGSVDILHLPGEAFVEYQLAAQKLRPNSYVCVAAYGDLGPGYIGLQKSYAEGGYETSHWASRVAPSVESTLTTAIAELLK